MSVDRPASDSGSEFDGIPPDPFPPVEARDLPECFSSEMSQIIDRARTDPIAARRLAELYELQDDFAKASEAWRHAAALGDPDAIEWVQQVLGG